jgi:hypothetical protein
MTIQGLGLASLGNCRQLRKLEITFAKRIDSFAGLGEARQLESLSIVGSRINEWRGLERLVNLRELTITGSEIRNTDLNRLGPLTKLKTLTLEGQAFGDPQVYFRGSGLGCLSSLTQLESLTLIGESIKPDAAEFMRSLSNLRSLTIDMTNIDDGATDAVMRMTNLTNAELGHLSNESVAKLSTHPSLEKLSFYAHFANSSGLATLGENRKLSELKLHGYWTPYNPLKFARDLKNMPLDRILAYDQIRLLMELADEQQDFESRRNFLAAGGFFMPLSHRDGSGNLIQPSDVRHPQHERFQAARQEFRQSMSGLQDKSRSLSELRHQNAAHARQLIAKAFSDDPQQAEHLVKIVEGLRK